MNSTTQPADFRYAIEEGDIRSIVREHADSLATVLDTIDLNVTDREVAGIISRVLLDEPRLASSIIAAALQKTLSEVESMSVFQRIPLAVIVIGATFDAHPIDRLTQIVFEELRGSSLRLQAADF